MDSGKVTLLGLLDLSAAFDTVDHSILLRRMETSYGFEGNIPRWVESFVRGRKQSVVFLGVRTPSFDLQFGAPQGSVLGPLLFVLYTTDVCDIVTSHGLGNHAYADDQQVYSTAYPDMQSCPLPLLQTVSMKLKSGCSPIGCN